MDKQDIKTQLKSELLKIGLDYSVKDGNKHIAEITGNPLSGTVFKIVGEICAKHKAAFFMQENKIVVTSLDKFPNI